MKKKMKEVEELIRGLVNEEESEYYTEDDDDEVLGGDSSSDTYDSRIVIDVI